MTPTESVLSTEYRELYPIEERDMSVLLHEPSNKLYMCKHRKYYDLQVYDYLKDHPHPNIASIHLFYEDDGGLFVLEEYIEGKNLRDILKEEGALSREQKLKILDGICDGLSFLHNAKPPIIHRDLKASNVILTNDGIVKLIDYDAAKTYKEERSEDTVHIGTPGIAAPEQYGFAQSDARTDIYALGKLTEQLLGNDPQYTEVIRKATEIDPRNRYQSAEEFKAALHSRHLIKTTKTLRRLVSMILLLLLIPAAWMLGRGSRRYTENRDVDDGASVSSDEINDHEISDIGSEETAVPVDNISISDTDQLAEINVTVSENSISDNIAKAESEEAAENDDTDTTENDEGNDVSDEAAETALNDRDETDTSDTVTDTAAMIQETSTSEIGQDTAMTATDPYLNAVLPDLDDSGILTPEQVAQIYVPTNSAFSMWGINFSIPYYFSSGHETLIGYAFSAPGVTGSLGFLTKQDYYEGGYHTLSQEEAQQVAKDWVTGHTNFTMNSYSYITVAGYPGTYIEATRTLDSGKIEYYRIVTFYDEANGETRVIRFFWQNDSADYPFSSDFYTMIQNAFR